jgi:hypothetical protein
MTNFVKITLGVFLISGSVSAIWSLILGHFMIVSSYESVNRAMDDLRIKWICVLVVLLIIGLYLMKPTINDETEGDEDE